MGAFYKSCDVIFEEGDTYFIQQPHQIFTSNNTNIYEYIEPLTSSTSEHIPEATTESTTLDHGIAPRPLPSTELHRKTTFSQLTSELQNNMQTKQVNELPLATR